MNSTDTRGERKANNAKLIISVELLIRNVAMLSITSAVYVLDMCFGVCGSESKHSGVQCLVNFCLTFWE